MSLNGSVSMSHRGPPDTCEFTRGQHRGSSRLLMLQESSYAAAQARPGGFMHFSPFSTLQTPAHVSDLQVHPPRSLWNLPKQHDFSRKQGPIGEVSTPHVQPVFTYPGRRSLGHTPAASPPLLHVLGRTMSLPLSDPDCHPVAGTYLVLNEVCFFTVLTCRMIVSKVLPISHLCLFRGQVRVEGSGVMSAPLPRELLGRQGAATNCSGRTALCKGPQRFFPTGS